MLNIETHFFITVLFQVCKQSLCKDVNLRYLMHLYIRNIRTVYLSYYMFWVSNCTSFFPLIVSTNKAINGTPPGSVY